MTESELQIAIADYLRMKYPKVMFHSDFGSGIKMTKGQAIKQKRQNGGRRGWPDMFIAEPRGESLGLFIELKKEGTRLFKKDGSFASEHIKEQADVMKELFERGYDVSFVIGFEDARKVIDEYMRKEPYGND